MSLSTHQNIDTDFCVYIHRRPDGTPFYVGKGRPRRAFDFAPSRRTRHHKNIVAKYGRDNIRIDVVPLKDEALAFEYERLVIKIMRNYGKVLVNLTDGGEGASGRPTSAKQAEGMKRGRGKEAYERMSEESKQRIIEGLRRGQKKSAAFFATEEGKKRRAEIVKMAVAAPRKVKQVVCRECGEVFDTKSGKALHCSRLCEQRNRRARQKLEGEK